MNIPFECHKIDLDKKIKNRQKMRDYYSNNKEKYAEKNRQNYMKRKNVSNEELNRRRADNRRAYYTRRDRNIRSQLEELKEKAVDSRKVLIDELLADNDYSHWGKQTLDVIAFLVKGKQSIESITNGTEGEAKEGREED